MRLFMFQKDGRKGLALANKGIYRGLGSDHKAYPGDLDYLFAANADFKAIEKELLQAPEIDINSIEFLPPLCRPGKIVCLGMNYKAHTEEFKRQLPKYPELFIRVPTTLVGHLQPIIKPSVSDQLDYEGEMALVIGKAGRHINRADAIDHIAAYSIFNDASIRDYQTRGLQWTPGKNFDSTGGFGPWLVSADELPSGGRGLTLTTKLNGQLMQKASTEDMIFDITEQIAVISQIMTLLPGDVIITGTPGGVGFGRDPKVFMKPGDICEIEIEGIGTLINSVKAQ